MTYLSQNSQTQFEFPFKVIQVVQRENMERTKLFYINIDGEDTYLIAEGEDEGKAAQNAVKEFQKIQKIYGEQNLPITNITRMDKIVDN